MTDTDQRDLASIDTIDMEENENVEGEFIQTEVKDDKMIKRNSVDNYKNDSAGVRETLANSVAAIMEAETEGYISEEDGQIIVKLEYEDQKWKLTIRDNGIGMTRDRLEVVSNMGDSTSSAYEDRIGKYGIGFFAIFLLVELSGGFMLSTRSRETGVGYLTRWRLRGAKVVQKGDIPTFSEDEYGTQIELYLKEDLSHEDVDDWIRTHAFASRRNVRYIKEDKAGVVTETEYPNVDIINEYQSEKGEFSIDSKWFSAITSPTAESQRFLLDISVPQEYSFMHLPWPVAVRFHTEEKTVVATEEYSVLDEGEPPEDSLIGMNILPSDQYDMLPQDMKDDYIPKRDLSEGAVYTPSTAGTRDSLSEVEQFMSWLQEGFQERFKQKIDPLLEKELPTEATEDELLFLYSVIGDCNSSQDIRRTLGSLTNKDLWNSSVQDELGNLVEHQINVEEATVDDLHEELSTSYSYGSKKFSAMGLHEYAESNDVAIYMGVNINENKAEVAKKHHSDVIFVKLSEAAEYSIYEPLGWNKLKNINKSFIRDLGLDEDAENEYIDILTTEDENDDATSVYDESITVRFGTGRRGNLVTISVSELIDKVKNSGTINNLYTPHQVVLFPDDQPENVSDYYDLGGSETCVAKCSQEVADHLTMYDNIQEYTEYHSEALSVTVATTEGYLTGKELRQTRPDMIVGTILKPNAYNMLGSEKMDKEIIAQTYKKAYGRVGRVMNNASNEILHITMTPQKERDIRPILQSMNTKKTIIHGNHTSSTHAPDWSTDGGWTSGIDTAKWLLLMKINASDAENKDTLRKFISRSSFNFGYGGEEFIETVVNGLR